MKPRLQQADAAASRQADAPPLIRRLDAVGMDDVAEVGGKNASLGEMLNALASSGVKVPAGFATTAAAYRLFLAHNGLEAPINEALAGLDIDDLEALQSAGRRIRARILEGTMPPDLERSIAAAYADMKEDAQDDPSVAVRSSATAEDLPTASFAGQQETLLNIRGIAPLLDACRHVYASLFTDRAIAYRTHQGFEHAAVALSIGVQRMARADLGCAGVMFTLDTESGFRDVVMINAAYGLGENVVRGVVNPDEFVVFKPTLQSGSRPIVRRTLGDKALRMVYVDAGTAAGTTRNEEVSDSDRRRFSIDDDDVLQLARHAMAIEAHYSQLAGRPTPMDIEWAKDGASGELYIIQARPETAHAQRAGGVLETYRLSARGTVLVTGKSVGTKIAAGRARVIRTPAEMHQLRDDEILVTEITDPDWEPIMKKAGAIVADRGGRTCHAAIVARELGIPAIVGTGDGTRKIATGAEVTVSCAEGDVGFVYDGLVPYAVDTQRIDNLPRPRTKIMVNLANPDLAFGVALLPNDGVGLARLEFIISHHIQAHPLALIHRDKLDAETRRRVDALTDGYGDAVQYYVQRLSEGIATIGAAFHPKPVIVRFSDFKSNEYSSLIGGVGFEPKEENPMLGFRGAARYPSAAFREAFALECRAIRAVREVMGLDNVQVMIPFVRTVNEAVEVLDLMRAEGLERGRGGLAVYLMCEIPANALLADRFLEHCDGFSIGSNDLTQLTLGVDRDSNLVTGTDERDPAVLALMEMAIKACRSAGKYVGICGQAPSDYPEITRWLVGQGIESISLNPDSLIAMTTVVNEAEKG